MNQQSSIISTPLCAPICTPNLGCADPIYTQCTYYTGNNLLCSGIFTGDDLTTALGKIDAQICSLIPASGKCTVQVDANDTGCGYLNDKIQTTTLVKSINNPNSFESLQLEDRPWLFQNVTLQGGAVTPAGVNFSPVRVGTRQGYPTTNNLLEVRFHGQLVAPNTVNGPVTIFTLPPSIRPLTTKYYNGYSNLNPNSLALYFIVIYPTGAVTLLTSPADSNSVIVPFDGINFVKN